MKGRLRNKDALGALLGLSELPVSIALLVAVFPNINTQGFLPLRGVLKFLKDNRKAILQTGRSSEYPQGHRCIWNVSCCQCSHLHLQPRLTSLALATPIVFLLFLIWRIAQRSLHQKVSFLSQLSRRLQQRIDMAFTHSRDLQLDLVTSNCTRWVLLSRSNELSKITSVKMPSRTKRHRLLSSMNPYLLCQC